jgi:hypothetical protein
MDSAFGSFSASNHAHLDCNDCHAPTESFLVKMTFKARAGMGHMYMNTIGRGDIPDVLHATSGSVDVVNDNCIKCHQPSLADGRSRRQGTVCRLPPVGAPRPWDVPTRRLARTPEGRSGALTPSMHADQEVADRVPGPDR